MLDVISHLAERLEAAVAALHDDGADALPPLSMAVLIGGRLHEVVGVIPLATWTLIEQVADSGDVMADDQACVVPLTEADTLLGVMVADTRDTPAPLAVLRLLGHHLGAELAHARRHERVESLLRTYTSTGVADALMASDSATLLGGRRQDVTMLFADLRGFTSFTERTASEVVVSHLNSVLTPAMRVIEAHGGTVSNLMGDGIMATFGAPRPQRDHPFRAAQAALALARSAIAEHPDLPRFGVGVNTGRVFVGNIGGGHRKVFTMIGDAVNLAARLESTTRPGQVVIGEETYQTIRSVAQVEALEPLTLKGKATPVQAYQLLSLEDPESGDQTIELPVIQPSA